MQRSITMPGPVYIESCGMIVSRGEVHRIDPAMRGMIDAWSAYHRSNDLETLKSLHYSNGTLHSGETVELCRRLTLSGSASNIALIYAHRGHHCQCKTPLLQSLLAKLAPCLQVHGMRVEQDYLPLDIVLFAAATLQECDRCIIVKDNAIRLGTTDVVSVTNTQYLVLSRSTGSWAIEGISIGDDDPAFPSRMAQLSLDTFLTEAHREDDSLSLASRMTNRCPGIIDIVRIRQNNLLVRSPIAQSAFAYSTGLSVRPTPALLRANDDYATSTFEHKGIRDA